MYTGNKVLSLLTAGQSRNIVNNFKYGEMILLSGLSSTVFNKESVYRGFLSFNISLMLKLSGFVMQTWGSYYVDLQVSEVFAGRPWISVDWRLAALKATQHKQFDLDNCRVWAPQTASVSRNTLTTSLSQSELLNKGQCLSTLSVQGLVVV